MKLADINPLNGTILKQTGEQRQQRPNNKNKI